jgi:hypothetical protein
MILGADILQKGQDSRFELLGKIDAKGTVGIVQDAVERPYMVGMFHQETIGCELVNVRVVGFLRGARGFDLDRDYLLSLPD